MDSRGHSHVHERAVHANSAAEQASKELLTTVA